MIELAGLVILVGLIAYAFGEHIARAFVAAFLAVCAVGLLFVVSVAVLDMRRQAIVQKQRDVHMLPNSWTTDGQIAKFTERMVRKCAGDASCLFPDHVQ